MAASEHTSDLDRIFIGLGSTIGEEGLAQIAWCNLLEQAAQFRPCWRRRNRWCDITEFVHLRLDGIDHPFIAMTDIDAHKLRVKIHIAFAIDIPHIDALGALNCKRFCGFLGSPFIQRRLARKVKNFLA